MENHLLSEKTEFYKTILHPSSAFVIASWSREHHQIQVNAGYGSSWPWNFPCYTRKVIAVYCANTQENYSTKQQLKTEIILRPLDSNSTSCLYVALKGLKKVTEEENFRKKKSLILVKFPRNRPQKIGEKRNLQYPVFIYELLSSFPHASLQLTIITDVCLRESFPFWLGNLIRASYRLSVTTFGFSWATLPQRILLLLTAVSVIKSVDTWICNDYQLILPEYPCKSRFEKEGLKWRRI